jgi:hypothetical protein
MTVDHLPLPLLLFINNKINKLKRNILFLIDPHFIEYFLTIDIKIRVLLKLQDFLVKNKIKL